MDGFCPYPGLRAFFTEEREWYFGREAHINDMLVRLETDRVLALVGSSGSGKSSLVYAGLIPALHEGQLAGSRRDANGRALPWRIVSFKPGNDPLRSLSEAILRAVPASGDPHLAGFVPAALRGGEGGLIEALDVADLLNERNEVLIYADQFEELFRCDEKSSRAMQEDALRFTQLLVAAAKQEGVPLYLLLSMRSEFIGHCERFPGLPELVGRNQFLTPRLSRRELEISLRSPAQASGWKIAPDALAAILNDCGSSPDQLPLAQHILRRMWHWAEEHDRRELTFDDYRDCGRISGALTQHGEEILCQLLHVTAPALRVLIEAQSGANAGLGTRPLPVLLEVARILFMALCDQREEGPLVRRQSARKEIAAIAGATPDQIAKVIAAFGGDDPGFLREEDGVLEVRHEVVLRQWPLIAQWRKREAESVEWLHDLDRAARAREACPKKIPLWQSGDLRGAGHWMRAERPGPAWAARHGVHTWKRCMDFLRRSNRARLLKTAAISCAIIALLGFAGFFALQRLQTQLLIAQREREFAARNKDFVAAFAQTADEIAATALTKAKIAANEFEQAASELLTSVKNSKTGEPPEPSAIMRLQNARAAVPAAAEEMDRIAKTITSAADLTSNTLLGEKARNLSIEAANVRNTTVLKRADQDTADQVVKDALEVRMSRAADALEKAAQFTVEKPGITRPVALEAAATATEQLSAIQIIREAAAELGYAGIGQSVAEKLNDYQRQLDRIQSIIKKTSATGQLAVWLPEPAWNPEHGFPPLTHGGRVNRIRFCPKEVDGPLIAAACEDRKIWFWYKDGRPRGSFGGTNPVNDVDFNPTGDALAAASNGSTVRILRFPHLPTIKTFAFERHSDSITDAEFSRGGDLVVSASADRTVRVFDSGSIAQLYFTSPPLPAIVTAAVFHPGGNLVASACDDGGVRLHTLVKPAVRLMGKFEAPARRPEFSPDGKVVLAASGDKTARLWSIERSGELARIEHQAPVTQATFRPVKEEDALTFITTATNGEVLLVHLDRDFKGQPLALEPRHSGAAVFAQWSGDGRWLATVGGGEVLLWESKADHLVARLRITGLHSATSRAEFSPDAKLLVTYGGDNLAYVWDLTQLPPTSQ
jgi:WD40 repeat protein